MYCALLSKLACLDGVHDDDDKEDTAVANLARPNERIVARSSQTDKEAEMRAGGHGLQDCKTCFGRSRVCSRIGPWSPEKTCECEMEPGKDSGQCFETQGTATFVLYFPRSRCTPDGEIVTPSWATPHTPATLQHSPKTLQEKAR